MEKEQFPTTIEPILVQYNPVPLIQNRCIERLGKNSGELFFFLWVRYIELQTLWGELQVILNTSKEHTELLRKYIPKFCLPATNSMWRELITSIVAYGDGNMRVKTRYAGFPELLRTLPESNQDQGLVMLNEFKEKSRPLLRMRHMHVAHYSKKAIGSRTKDSLSQKEVANGMQGIKTVLSGYCRIQKFPYPTYEGCAAEVGGAQSLLAILEKHDKSSSNTHEI